MDLCFGSASLFKAPASAIHSLIFALQALQQGAFKVVVGRPCEEKWACSSSHSLSCAHHLDPGNAATFVFAASAVRVCLLGPILSPFRSPSRHHIFPAFNTLRLCVCVFLAERFPSITQRLQSKQPLLFLRMSKTSRGASYCLL